MICKLNHKKMNELYFSSCNSANPDAQNVASEFSKIVEVNTIAGWDGGTVYKYNDEEPEKSEEGAGGEGYYDQFEVKFIDGCGWHLVPTETSGQPTWWKCVKKDEFGKSVREREEKVIVK
ncbi:hypothetical protein CLOBY_08470 [Clostridium saccharobutylicum]|uniref:hypothetical protein n=1 Tax=Clostridium saccharobutylicum TaxID=169679 RepID=UPI000983A72B|nr:hypothetical protein [Clostridium saccharobutylicum]AQS08737.1 hypothetical protein CLOBY_08470 [Clostridium saccharobutylicum]MBC2438747.1 hypothetical protein [Clostridium saccharobutylicum]NSB91033.1 hypothetical protein [Clostridium saccharobutylicum]NYC28917.1 hypothetical protein [Clostridium saccharobutylicum]OOM18387.1 hypothetical protein CLSAB_07480 [Clostridium saccharobutylicum]